MKSYTLITVLSLCTMMACAQTVKVPDATKKAFQSKFASAKSVKWSMEEQNEYEAEFKMNGKEMSASYDAQGKWMETEAEINKNKLPAAIKQTIAAQFAGYKIGEASELSSPTLTNGYEVELEKGETTIEVQFDAMGKVVKKTEKKDEDDEK